MNGTIETPHGDRSRRVLVTGSSRGLGRAIARGLHACGYQVTLHGRSRSPEIIELAKELSRDETAAEILTFDVSDRQHAAEALSASLDQHGAFYGVVCNAGITSDGPFPGLSGEDWDRVIRTNLDGFFNVVHPLVMPMIQLRGGGRIVVLSSVAGLVGNRGQVNYSASKAGLIGAAKALSKELAKRRITVNCVAPGFIESDMTKDLPLEQVQNMIPMHRLGRPEEVASAVCYFFSPGAEYTTGQVLSVNGGLA